MIVRPCLARGCKRPAGYQKASPWIGSFCPKDRQSHGMQDDSGQNSDRQGSLGAVHRPDRRRQNLCSRGRIRREGATGEEGNAALRDEDNPCPEGRRRLYGPWESAQFPRGCVARSCPSAGPSPPPTCLRFARFLYLTNSRTHLQSAPIQRFCPPKFAILFYFDNAKWSTPSPVRFAFAGGGEGALHFFIP